MTIKELRRKHNMTQDSLAEAVGCSRITIARMEAGKAPVTLKILEGLSKALDVPVSEMYAMIKDIDDSKRRLDTATEANDAPVQGRVNHG